MSRSSADVLVSDNVPVARAFGETEPCYNNNNPQNRGKLAHIKMFVMFLLRVCLVHDMLYPDDSVCECKTCSVWIRAPQTHTHTPQREKNISDARKKGSHYTWQVLAEIQTKPQSFKDKFLSALLCLSARSCRNLFHRTTSIVRRGTVYPSRLF